MHWKGLPVYSPSSSSPTQPTKSPGIAEKSSLVSAIASRPIVGREVPDSQEHLNPGLEGRDNELVRCGGSRVGQARRVGCAAWTQVPGEQERSEITEESTFASKAEDGRTSLCFSATVPKPIPLRTG